MDPDTRSRLPDRPRTSRRDLRPLTEIGWLAAQPPLFQEWMADADRWKEFAKGQPLYQAGDEPEALHGLGHGALEVLLPAGGEELVTIHRAEPGFWIGDSAILARAPRVLSVLAASDCRVFSVPAAAIHRILAEKPQFWACFYELSHLNASRAVVALAELLSQSSEARLARILLRLADTTGETRVTQTDLARLLGVTRSSLQRALASLANEDSIATGYGFVRIVDRAKLQKVVDQG